MKPQRKYLIIIAVVFAVILLAAASFLVMLLSVHEAIIAEARAYEPYEVASYDGAYILSTQKIIDEETGTYATFIISSYDKQTMLFSCPDRYRTVDLKSIGWDNESYNVVVVSGDMGTITYTSDAWLNEIQYIENPYDKESGTFEALEYYIFEAYAGVEQKALEDSSLYEHAEQQAQGLYSYTWGRFYTVISEYQESTSGAVSMPFADNYDAETGYRLVLPNLFWASEEEYAAAIVQSMKTPVLCSDEQVLEELLSGRELPLPSEENFFITPNGIAFMYQAGEISAQSAGPIIVMISYDGILNILSDHAFGMGTADNDSILQVVADSSYMQTQFEKIISLNDYAEGTDCLIWCEQPIYNLSISTAYWQEFGTILELSRERAIVEIPVGTALMLTADFEDDSLYYKLSYTREDGTYEECLLGQQYSSGEVFLRLLKTPQLVVWTDSTWGMDDAAIALWQSGALDAYVPRGEGIYSAKCADLNMDGVLDVLMLTESAAPRLYGYSGSISTFVLLGDGNGGFTNAAQDDDVAYNNDYYGDSTRIDVGNGWFRFINTVGKAGGYEKCKLYEYELTADEWILAELYNNCYGYHEVGISQILTPIHFGRVTFGAPMQYISYNRIPDYSYESETIRISGRWAEISLQDTEKQKRINDMLYEEYLRMAEYLKTQDANVYFRTDILLQTPLVLCVEYTIWGEVNGINCMGSGRRYTSVIDLETEKHIKLSDVVDMNIWKDVLCADSEKWVSDWSSEWSSVFPAGFEALPKYCDDIDALFSSDSGGFFWAIHERSLAIYWQPEFWQPSSEDIKLYILSDDIRPYVKLDLWSYESRAAEHMEWKG